MATKRKDRVHLTGKSNQKNLFRLSDSENNYRKVEEKQAYPIFKDRRSTTKKSSTKNQNIVNNFSETISNIPIVKSHSDEEGTFLLRSFKNAYLPLDKNRKKGIEFKVEKHERSVNDTSRLVSLNDKETAKNDYSKGNPSRFKGGGVKRIDPSSTPKEMKIKKEKEIDPTVLWDYLSMVHHSEDSRLKNKLVDILNKRNKDANGTTEKKEHIAYAEYTESLIKKEKINYNEYKSIVQYILPSTAKNKIKHSWEFLKENVNSKEDTVSCDDLLHFLNERVENKNGDSVCKIVGSKLQNKQLNYSYAPEDVKLKTCNYVDNIRLKASEFSQNFKQLVTEEELKNLFKGREKIPKKELEICITNIIQEKMQLQKESKPNEKREDMIMEETTENNASVLTKVNKDGLRHFSMQAYISTLLSNKNEEVYTKSFIENLQVDYKLLNSQNVTIKDAYDLYTRSIPPTEIKDDVYHNTSLNEEEMKRAQYLIEEIDYSIRNNAKPLYVNTNKENKDTCYLSKYDIFKHLDADKDSYLTADDLRISLNKLRMKDMKDSDVNLLLKYMDSEKKGYVHVNDFLKNYTMEEKSMRIWMRNANKPYYDFIKNLKKEVNGGRKRCVSSHEYVEYNENAKNAKKYEDVVNNYNLELDPCCTSYVIRERIRENFMARKEDMIDKHLKATRFHITGYKNTNQLTQPVKESALYIDDASRFKTTYELNYT